jgi:hypothetical protein
VAKISEICKPEPSSPLLARAWDRAIASRRARCDIFELNYLEGTSITRFRDPRQAFWW